VDFGFRICLHPLADRASDLAAAKRRARSFWSFEHSDLPVSPCGSILGFPISLHPDLRACLNAASPSPLFLPSSNHSRIYPSTHPNPSCAKQSQFPVLRNRRKVLLQKYLSLFAAPAPAQKQSQFRQAPGALGGKSPPGQARPSSCPKARPYPNSTAIRRHATNTPCKDNNAMGGRYEIQTSKTKPIQTRRRAPGGQQ